MRRSWQVSAVSIALLGPSLWGLGCGEDTTLAGGDPTLPTDMICPQSSTDREFPPDGSLVDCYQGDFCADRLPVDPNDTAFPRGRCPLDDPEQTSGEVFIELRIAGASANVRGVMHFASPPRMAGRSVTITGFSAEGSGGNPPLMEFQGGAELGRVGSPFYAGQVNAFDSSDVDTATDIIDFTPVAHNLDQGPLFDPIPSVRLESDRIFIDGSGNRPVLPAPLLEHTDYYVIVLDAFRIQLAASAADADPTNPMPIDLIDVGNDLGSTVFNLGVECAQGTETFTESFEVRFNRERVMISVPGAAANTCPFGQQTPAGCSNAHECTETEDIDPTMPEREETQCVPDPIVGKVANQPSEPDSPERFVNTLVFPYDVLIPHGQGGFNLRAGSKLNVDKRPPADPTDPAALPGGLFQGTQYWVVREDDEINIVDHPELFRLMDSDPALLGRPVLSSDVVPISSFGDNATRRSHIMQPSGGRRALNRCSYVFDGAMVQVNNTTFQTAAGDFEIGIPGMYDTPPPPRPITPSVEENGDFNIENTFCGLGHRCLRPGEI